MRASFYVGGMTLCLALFPVSGALAQHCQPYWTEQYAMGCGPGAQVVVRRHLVYNTPAVQQPSREEELLARQATALNNQGVALYGKHKFREAIRMFEASLGVLSTQKTRENLGAPTTSSRWNMISRAITRKPPDTSN